MSDGERYLTIQDVARKAGVSTKTIRRKVKRRECPPPFRFAGGLRWLFSDVEKWLIKTAIENAVNPDDKVFGGSERDQAGHGGTSDFRPPVSSGKAGKTV